MADTKDLPDVAFVHRSDIHLRKGQVGDLHDADAAIRNELERDLRRLRSRVSRLDGIIISGDVAFAGKPAEYAFGGSWIESIREQLQCDPGGVMCIPGNHDVDRALVSDGSEVEKLQLQIRPPGAAEERTRVIASILRDPVKGPSLFSPIKAYPVESGYSFPLFSTSLLVRHQPRTPKTRSAISSAQEYDSSSAAFKSAATPTVAVT